MKRFFVVLGVVFAVLLVVMGVFIGFAAYKGSKLDASSKAYVDANVPPIVSTWSEAELLKRASPELLKVVSAEELSLLFKKLSQLGSLVKYEEAKGNSNIVFTSAEGKVITANYVAKATFDKGSATIQIRLIEKNGQWKLLRFYVDSPIFLK